MDYLSQLSKAQQKQAAGIADWTYTPSITTGGSWSGTTSGTNVMLCSATQGAQSFTGSDLNA